MHMQICAHACTCTVHHTRAHKLIYMRMPRGPVSQLIT